MNEIDILVELVYDQLETFNWLWTKGEFPPGYSFRTAVMSTLNFPRLAKQQAHVRERIIDKALSEYMKLKRLQVI